MNGRAYSADQIDELERQIKIETSGWAVTRRLFLVEESCYGYA